ncbi:MAG: Phosphate transport system regulatory protein PhoU [Bacteriovoracaceae bacterium]|nr:Phosphate transport system regulatory protein PhoU [Bacteriovoracaceae bacterium]
MNEVVKHTSHQFDEDLKRLKDSLVLMGGMIESMLKDTSDALLSHNMEIAQSVIDRDNELDQLEKRVDEQAIQVLALRQPAAQDLRFVTASMKICTDLERMGDIIVNICERLVELSKFSPVKSYRDLPRMMECTGKMITKSIDAFVNLSMELASEVLQEDDEVDALFRSIWSELIEMMRQNPSILEPGVKLLFIAKHLERLADHTTNIAEQVIFTVKGLDVRHSGHLKPTP